jgi:hypothetical protein
VCFPSFGYAEIHPFVALSDDWGFSPVATGDQGCAPWMAPLFKKSLAKTFNLGSLKAFILLSPS